MFLSELALLFKESILENRFHSAYKKLVDTDSSSTLRIIPNFKK